MTLARYDNTALSLDRRKRGVVAKFPWGRSRGSRYCPHCLDEFQGRWQLQWPLIRDDRISFTAAAAQLGTTIDALRYVMEHQPAPETLTTAQRRARSVLLAAAEQALPRHMFIELYRYQGLGLQEIAGRFSVSKSTITRLAQLYEIPLRRPGGRQRSKIPEDWLWCQYVTLGRTLPQVAAAAGMSTSAISRRAKKAGIPIRSPGGPSHAATAAVDGYEILRPAIDSVAGFHRLKILAATARYKTYESAAAAINSAATTCTSSSSKQKPTSAITSSTGSAARPRSGSLRTDAMLLSLCNRCSPHDPPELFPGRSPARTGCFRATTTRRSHALLGRGCSADIRIDSYCKTTTILRRPHNISPDRRQFAEGSRQPGCSNVCSKLWHRRGVSLPSHRGDAARRRSKQAMACQTFPPSPFQVCGAILDKYLQTGGPNGFLQFPKSDELTNPDGFGREAGVELTPHRRRGTHGRGTRVTPAPPTPSS